LIGILTKKDIHFEKDLSQKVASRMTKENLITAPSDISFEEAEEIFRKTRVEKLPLVDKEGKLVGLITFRDLRQRRLYPRASRDSQGRLMVGAAVGVLEEGQKRAQALIEAGADLIVIDTSHGHSKDVIETLKALKRDFPEVQIVAGNVATEEGALALIEAGADAIKVNIGGGSICTTRVVTGVGVPQLTAIMECAKVCQKYQVPLISDGGIRYSGDIAKALAAGADSVMIGSLFAGTEESPAQEITFKGSKYKIYRGMGTLEVMKEMRERGERIYQTHEELIPQGIEGLVPCRGPIAKIITQLIGGLKMGMGLCGASNLKEFQSKTWFRRVTHAGYIEAHPHNVIITQEAPNYWREEEIKWL
jgi:IMP dehydrogenase